MKLQAVVLVVILLIALALPIQAEELTGKQIVTKMSDRQTSDTLVMQVKMTITDKRGDSRVRSIISRMKKTKDGSNTVVTFIKPEDVKGTKFLVIEKPGDDDQLLYMPALKKVRRISSKQKSGKFMGTDFSYSDLQSHDPEKGTHTRLQNQTIDGQECYQIQTTPKNPDDFEYSKIIYWVRIDNDVPIKSEFYDKAGVLLKVLTVTSLEKDSTDNWVIKDTLMKNVQKNTATRMEILQYKTDKAISDDKFTERFLADETQM
jgi:outer membrane lipoprotein-sorting protein